MVSIHSTGYLAFSQLQQPLQWVRSAVLCLGPCSQQGQLVGRVADCGEDELEPAQHFCICLLPHPPAENSGRCFSSSPTLRTGPLLASLTQIYREEGSRKCSSNLTKLKVKLGAMGAVEQEVKRPETGAKESFRPTCSCPDNGMTRKEFYPQAAGTLGLCAFS